MEQAPLYDDVARAPDGGRAVWINTLDGARLRAAWWGAGTKGTVLLLTGRTEYIEKYGPAASEFAARGYATLTWDWRGQGLSDRPLPDKATGHIDDFLYYQRDFHAALALAREENLPRPWYMVAHSMGGCIGLRALMDGAPVNAVAFSAPMWGIRLNPVVRPIAWGISAAGRYFGRGHLYAPGTRPVTYVVEAPFEGNVLTTDTEMYAFMRDQVTRHPDLALGGPSLHWLHEALLEANRLASKPSPSVPCYTALGMAERVVDTAAIRARMRHWAGGRLDLVPRAEHEVMMEGPAIRKRFYDAAAALFDAHR